MSEMHKAIFHDNEVAINELLKHLNLNKKEKIIDRVILTTNYDGNLGDNIGFYIKKEEDEDVFSFVTRSSHRGKPTRHYYWKWISSMIFGLVESRFSSIGNKIVYYSYHTAVLTENILQKFICNNIMLTNLLPPLILCAPEEHYMHSSQPHFTLKSNPVYIVKTGN
jgi:hypothetical protein